MVMKEAFMGARAVASLTKLKMSQLGKRGQCLIDWFGTDLGLRH